MKIGLTLLTSLCFACASGSVDSSPSAPRGSRDAEPPVGDARPADALLQDAVVADMDPMTPPMDMAPVVDMAPAIDMRPLMDMAPPVDMAPAEPEPPVDMAPAEPEPPVDMAPQPEPEPAPVDMMVPVEVPERLLINEIDYDQAGNDLMDFVEIYNPSAVPAPLDAVTVEFINGDPLETYRVVPLDGVLASGARLVLGQQAVLDALPGGVRGILIADGIQNGAPDAIRLMTPQGPLDGVAYEGDLPGFGEGAGPITADQGLDAAGSLARCPDGSDTDDNATDVRLVPRPTPGAANACP